MLQRTIIEVGHPAGDSPSGPTASFHLTLPIKERNCDACVEAADAGMREISALVAELEGRIRRESLINAIGDAVRGMIGTRTIKMIASRGLGDYLGLDRCYFIHYDLDHHEAVIEYDWRRPDLTSIAGTYQIDSATVKRLSFMHHGAEAYVGSPDHPILPMVVGGAVTLIQVPLLESQSVVGALVATMETCPREWTREDVELTETVASIARSAIDMDRIRARERGLRSSFRSAILPSVPTDLHGARVAVVYRPIDAAAGVGGDFYDIFRITDEKTAFVLADVSAHGLAAATDVTMLRNMLRCSLYQNASLPDAVDKVARIIAENGLLSNGASMFAGVYDRPTGQLSYVSCGHEPAILVRPNEIVFLDPDAARLGAMAQETIVGGTATVEPGDALVVYSDGLTAIGGAHNRAEFQAQAADILGQCRRPLAPGPIVDSVMAGIIELGIRESGGVTVHSATEYAFDDDVCVLAAVFGP
ncbi:MAG: PP2C family protein-serine/threonine phosphatase [Capsulimonadaceae bacterium]